ncbi:MAG: polysaccharide deacetylase family protein [Verrucomicrobiota bacterium]|nr:polysaccharide deacetylase family protein [Verrucomicrobiota bacterium]
MPTIPFQERKSCFRGAMDVLTLRYPGFLFGTGLGRSLPVFHFHEALPDALEPYFRHLAENGYRTVTSEAIDALVLRGVDPGPKSVAICFDDAWSSLWFVVQPLLETYGLTAIVYVSPDRVPSVPEQARPPFDGPIPPVVDRMPPLFCTWSELKALHALGRMDIQAHSWRHAQVFSSGGISGFIRPDQTAHPHDIPLLETPDGLRFATREDLGAPLYPMRSRLSDVRRWRNPAAFEACTTWVRGNGGASFFDRPDWEKQLRRKAREAGPGVPETMEQEQNAVTEELAQSRNMLESQLGKKITHMCFPWAIAGETAVQAAARVGFHTACSDRLGGRRAVHAGDPPYRLMRLKHLWIPCLPGQGRKWFFLPKYPGASNGMDLTPPRLPETA